ncbi:MAG: M48 family metallopeptidase [Candidatus Sericytochromatia bacterium]|nr:M48 family metallopeptidase [Candidatus Sericytochromatia bacterium]
MPDAQTLTALFLALLAASVLLQWGLAWRQASHLRRARSVVPPRFAAQVTLADHQKAIDYALSGLRLGRLTEVLGLAFLLALLWGGGLAWWLSTLGHWVVAGQLGPMPAAIALVVGVVLLQTLLNLPLSAYAQFGIEARFGFNRMTWQTFLLDLFKGMLLLSLLGVPLLAVALWLMGHRVWLGGAWWVALWAVQAIFTAGLAVAFPVWIAPLFNTFKPLEEGALKARLEGLLERCQFSAQGLYVMDGSRRSSHGNAFFAGLGRTRRIVLFDTLVARLSESNLEAVLAHEIGHYRCGHIPRLIGAELLTSFVGFAAFGLWMDHPAIAGSLGIPTALLSLHAGPLTDSLGIILFTALLPFVTFPLQPLFAWLPHRFEYEADAYAAQTSSASELMDALVALHRDNAAPLTLDPWYSRFHDSHPPTPLRIGALERLATVPAASR